MSAYCSSFILMGVILVLNLLVLVVCCPTYLIIHAFRVSLLLICLLLLVMSDHLLPLAMSYGTLSSVAYAGEILICLHVTSVMAVS